jgi:hypothetical protein
MFSLQVGICAVNPEAEFLDVIGTKVLRVFLLTIHSQLYQLILLPPPHLEKMGLKLVYNGNSEYGNLKSEKIMPRKLNEIVGPRNGPQQ